MSAKKPGNYKLIQTQKQVDELVNIMRDNVQKILKRDQKFGDLEDQSDALEDGAQRFEKKAIKLKRNLWCKNMKFILILSATVTILILVIALVFLKTVLQILDWDCAK